MGIARILVDGYSLLHAWTALAEGKPRHSAAARAALIHQLTQYRDATGTPLTIIFDGISGPRSAEEPPSTPEVEILYSQAGQTADHMIERLVHLLKEYGEVLVVTDDHGERDTVESAGGIVSGCLNFISGHEMAVSMLDKEIEHHNRKETARYKHA